MNALRFLWLAIGSFYLAFVAGCSKDNNNPSPTTPSSILEVKTNASTLRFENQQFEIQGSVTSKDNFTLVSRGICFDYTSLPFIRKSPFVEAGNTFGEFTARFSPTAFDRILYLRAFAISKSAAGKTDTSYGNEVVLNPLHSPKSLSIEPRGIDSLVFTWAGLKQNAIPGLGSVLGKGVCWSTSADPKPVNGQFVSGAGADTTGFTGVASGLAASTVYYFRSYAINNADTVFGQNVVISTSFRDSEQNTYKTIRIGGQLWMQQNLNSTRFPNGEPLNNNPANAVWDTTTQPAFANTSSPDPSYGRLYNHYAVVDARKLCPTGWHLPTRAEWDTLFNQLGGWNVAGLKMKTNVKIWPGDVLSGQGVSGFNALPTGYKSASGSLEQAGRFAYWWIASSGSSPVAVKINDLNDEVFTTSSGRQQGYAVRCLKD